MMTAQEAYSKSLGNSLPCIEKLIEEACGKGLFNVELHGEKYCKIAANLEYHPFTKHFKKLGYTVTKSYEILPVSKGGNVVKGVMLSWGG